MMKQEWKQLINGQLVEGQGRQTKVYNPATGEVIATFNTVSNEQALEAAAYAKEAFAVWSNMSITEREAIVLKFADILDAHRDEIIDILVAETGKPQGNADYDFQMLPDCLRYFAEQAKHLEGGLIPDYTGEHISMTIRKPVGVVVGYLAWNFPILNLGYKLGPILSSGCTCVLKPASPTPLASMYIGALSLEAGFPAGVINMVVGSGAEICKTLNESTIPDLITLIGSSETGRTIMEQSATSIKHYSLELGGNAPVIVMKDADVADAALKTADLKYGNAGQVCVCANRVFVHKEVKEEFIKGVLAYTDRITLGSGKDEADVLMGPVVSDRAQQQMQDLVDDAVAKGATVLCGGKKADKDGYFFEPTVLDGVTPEMRVYQEEIFGPIMPILTFDDDADIVAMANDTCYGLAAYLYTNDLKTALNISRKIDSGNVCVNEPFYNFNLPHGGCKESGVGKDCSTFSFEEYFYVQRITVKL